MQSWSTRFRDTAPMILKLLHTVLPARYIASRIHSSRRCSTRRRPSWQSCTRATTSQSKKRFCSTARPCQLWRAFASRTLTGGEAAKRREHFTARGPTSPKNRSTHIPMRSLPVTVLGYCFWPMFTLGWCARGVLRWGIRRFGKVRSSTTLPSMTFPTQPSMSSTTITTTTQRILSNTVLVRGLSFRLASLSFHLVIVCIKSTWKH